MKKIFLLGFLIILCSLAFAQTDSVAVNEICADEVVHKVEKELQSIGYYLFEKDLEEDEVLLYYPRRILANAKFDIEIRFKGEPIFLYEVDSKDYKLTGIIADVR